MTEFSGGVDCAVAFHALQGFYVEILQVGGIAS